MYIGHKRKKKTKYVGHKKDKVKVNKICWANQRQTWQMPADNKAPLYAG